jgi:hypothetical protein
LPVSASFTLVGDGACRVNGANSPAIRRDLDVPAADLTECQERCIALPTCVGIDFFAAGPKEGRCQMQKILPLGLPDGSTGNPTVNQIKCYRRVSAVQRRFVRGRML